MSMKRNLKLILTMTSHSLRLMNREDLKYSVKFSMLLNKKNPGSDKISIVTIKYIMENNIAPIMKLFKVEHNSGIKLDDYIHKCVKMYFIFMLYMNII